MISLRAIKTIFKKEGARRISKKAIVAVQKILELKAREIARNAIKNARYSGRVVIKEIDVKNAS
jgi:histone H3/H4